MRNRQQQAKTDMLSLQQDLYGELESMESQLVLPLRFQWAVIPQVSAYVGSSKNLKDLKCPVSSTLLQ